MKFIRALDVLMNPVSDLSFFVVLARQPSLAAAAQVLGVAPPNVSRRLAGLERRLGLRLLNRTTRRLSLTEAGRRYLERGEQIMLDLAGLEQSLATDRDAVRGQLRINASFGFGRRHLAPLISVFSRQYPEVEFVLELSDHPRDLTEHAYDIGIRFGEPPDSRVVARRIAGNRRLLCASPAYLAEAGHPETPQSLSRHRCIVIRENAQVYNHWHLCDGERHELVKVGGPLSANHGEIAVDWALAGHGVVLRSEWDVAGYLRSGELLRVLSPWIGDGADIHAVYPNRHFVPAKVRVFLDFLEAHFADTRGGPTSADGFAW